MAGPLAQDALTLYSHPTCSGDDTFLPSDSSAKTHSSLLVYGIISLWYWVYC